jgi:hypothetical protein
LRSSAGLHNWISERSKHDIATSTATRRFVGKCAAGRLAGLRT